MDLNTFLNNAATYGPSGWSLRNAWPTMLSPPSTPALPAPAGVPAVTGAAGLPAAVAGARAAAPGLLSRLTGLARLGLGGPAGAGAMAAGQVMAPVPANQGEKPFYGPGGNTNAGWTTPPNGPPSTYPNEPSGSFGGGSTLGTAPNNYGLPLPQPRPAAAPAAAPQGLGAYEGNVASPANPFNNGQYGVGGGAPPPSGLQQFLASLRGAQPSGPAPSGPSFMGAPSAQGAMPPTPQQGLIPKLGNLGGALSGLFGG